MNHPHPELDLELMNLSEGQRLALDQLQYIEVESDYEFEIIAHQSLKSNVQYLEINVSISTRGFEKKQDGFLFRPRERLNILIHKNFPFELPIISFSDTRYIGKPHVQWGRNICLYQSVESDFDPSDGMFGFMDRLVLWLKKAAKRELDPVDAPLHPPVAYTSSKINFKLIPNKNVPDFNNEYWLGAGKLEKLNDTCYLVEEWYELGKIKNKENYAAVILLKHQMPFEYPYFFISLINLLARRNIDLVTFVKHLQSVIRFNKAGKSLFVVIGTPMRGDVADPKQHILCWYLESKVVSHLTGFDINRGKKDFNKAKDHLDKFIKYAEKAEIQWCQVLENRSEVIIPRDKESLTFSCANKKIAIWGAGALGSHIAEIIVRAKAKKVQLYDKGIVKPGILSRQLFYDKDIGKNKALVLKERLKNIYSNLYTITVEGFAEDILNHLQSANAFNDTDIIIDTTASQRVFRKADKLLIEKKINAPLISLVINNDAKKAMVIFRPVNYNSGIFDIMRQAKLKLCSLNKIEWLSAFFPTNGETVKLIQPEPGCSDPTFIGSEADLSTLSGLMINVVSTELFTSDEAKVYFISQEIMSGKDSVFEQYSFKSLSNDLLLLDSINDYKIFLNQDVVDKIKVEISKSDKKHKPPHETGGLLFGEWDDLTKTVYVNEISGPPVDSKSAPNHFDCGVEGTKELNDKLKAENRGSIYFVGLWHSHPLGSAMFSGEDKASMHLVVTKLSPPKSLLLIVAYNKNNYSLGGFVFNKSQFK